MKDVKWCNECRRDLPGLAFRIFTPQFREFKRCNECRENAAAFRHQCDLNGTNPAEVSRQNKKKEKDIVTLFNIINKIVLFRGGEGTIKLLEFQARRLKKEMEADPEHLPQLTIR